MTVQEISIELGGKLWHYMPSWPLGPAGGFGEVFLGRSNDNKPAAVKRLKFSAEDAANRELKMAEYLIQEVFQNVMPILDAGRDSISGAYFIIMPVGDMSLQDAVNKGVHTPKEAAIIMSQITNGLLEVPDIVHRDLKPGNVLLHAERWKITDFGIARFADAATSMHTLKDVLSAYYAAPEQWKLERATTATDVYALGCIGYALLTGKPPFAGINRDELRDHHLSSDPPDLKQDVPPRFRTLLTSMLRKTSEARPSASKVQSILNQILSNDDENLGVKALAEAAAKVEGIHASRDRKLTVEARAKIERDGIAQTGRAILSALTKELRALTSLAAPNAIYSTKGEIELGDAVLHLPGTTSRVLPVGLFRESKWDVLLGEALGVIRNSARRADDGYIISASLWYAKLPDTEQYRWYEASYWGAFRNDRYSPYELTDKILDADLAAGKVTHVYDLCWGPYPVDDDDAEEFKERWLALFAKAADGSLARPSTLPLRRYYWKDGQY